MKRKLSLHSMGLKKRIWVAIALTTLLPALIFFYYISGNFVSIPTMIIIGAIIFFGWWIVLERMRSVITIYSRAKDTLEGMGEEIPEVSDEIKVLDSIATSLSLRVKSSLDQLRDFGKKTEELNKEVSKKVFVLSAILQANDLFSKQTPSEEIVQFLLQRLKEILDMKVCFCSVKNEGAHTLETLACAGTDVSRVESVLQKETKAFSAMKTLGVVDRENSSLPRVDWSKDLGIQNIVVRPMRSRGKFIGIVGMGNSEDDFVFTTDDLNILNLFSQNIAFMWEHKELLHKIEESEIFDSLTGFYNDKFTARRLDEEIQRAVVYQRPCGFLFIQIANYEDYQKEHGLIEGEKLVKKVAGVFKETLRPIDIAGRIGPDKLAAILIEKTRRQSQEVAHTLKEKLRQACADTVKIIFGVAENPLDGADAQELILFAQGHKHPL
ncbi:MAG: diguanylate cyclase [Candidatus Omnitrophota bacterium]|nr:MAG: diguanylate cyclase [Candidatus Omnitrophota bacterium]